MAAILVRALDPVTWDAQRGNGLSNYLSDKAAVAQIIAQRLRLLKGELFQNTATGTPLFQSLLAQPITNRAIALILQERILSAPFVTAISSLQVVYNGATRNASFTAVVQTAFGSIQVGSV